jgi:hypothetical protein
MVQTNYVGRNQQTYNITSGILPRNSRADSLESLRKKLEKRDRAYSIQRTYHELESGPLLIIIYGCC